MKAIMVRKWLAIVPLAVLVSLMLIPAAARAQTGIAGTVKDTTGGVLPGVTVEVASPALIERTRTAVTDGQGRYRIVDLRPSTYVVTFTLPGFTVFVREGIELVTNFTATVDAELRVGSLDESVTVTGASPVVDVQNVVQHTVIPAEVIESVPSARSFQNLGALIPGMVSNLGGGGRSRQGVGGSAGERGTLTIHGGRRTDMVQQVDGQPFGVHTGEGSATGYVPSPVEVQEYSYELGAIGSETASGGVRMNLIPKEGGNQLSGLFYLNFTNSTLQSDNYTDDLRNRGLPTVNRMLKAWDVKPIAQHGPTFRVPQCKCARTASRSDAVRGPAALRRGAGRAELDRPYAAAGRRLRLVWKWQDGAEGDAEPWGSDRPKRRDRADAPDGRGRPQDRQVSVESEP